jgi:imidazolonepropionase-like amidohydrolase
MRSLYLFLSLLLLPACASHLPVPHRAADVTLAIINVHVIDVEAGEVLPGRTVLIAGDRIASVEPATITVPRGARLLDGAGRYLIPGLWDMHVHLTHGSELELAQFVRHGVVGVRDMGGSWEQIETWRKAIAEGRLAGPRIRAAGPIIENAAWLDAVRSIPEGRAFLEASPRLAVRSADDARSAVQELAGLGVDFVKVRNVPPGEAWPALLEAARTHQLRVVTHLPAGDLRLAVERGLDGFEHLDSIADALDVLPDIERQRLFGGMAGAGVFVGPTLVPEMMRLLPVGVIRALVEDDDGLLDPRRRRISASLAEFWRTQQSLDRYDVPRDWAPVLDRGIAHLREMHRAGVPLLAGTDFGARLVYPGSSLHDELYLLVEKAGLSPAAALRTATLNAARFFSADAQFGRIAVGQIADLVLLRSNPLEEIRNVSGVEAVIIGGRLQPE